MAILGEVAPLVAAVTMLPSAQLVHRRARAPAPSAMNCSPGKTYAEQLRCAGVNSHYFAPGLEQVHTS